MNVQIELWHLVTMAIAMVCGFWALLKVMGSQFQRHLDVRFSAQEEANGAYHSQLSGRLDRIEAANLEESRQWQRVERDLLRWQAEMPVQYVRRDDYIRGQSVLEAKIDGLGTKLENNRLRERIEKL